MIFDPFSNDLSDVLLRITLHVLHVLHLCAVSERRDTFSILVVEINEELRTESFTNTLSHEVSVYDPHVMVRCL